MVVSYVLIGAVTASTRRSKHQEMCIGIEDKVEDGRVQHFDPLGHNPARLQGSAGSKLRNLTRRIKEAD
jgi:hypothetical protein